MSDSSTELLTAHHLPYRVVNVIENATEYVVLVTAYLQTWTHLDHAIRSAIARGVRVAAVLRSPDGSKREQDKKREEADALAELGVRVHFVDRLHAKAYMNENELIVTSFNLVHASQDSIELGVHFQEAALAQQCLSKIRAYCPELEVGKPAEPTRSKSPVATSPTAGSAYCIGCADPMPSDPSRPLCKSCYRSSRRGTELEALPRRTCHRCGSAHSSSLVRPICIECWKTLSKDEQTTLKQILSAR